MSWRDVIVGLSLSASMLAAFVLSACSSAEDGMRSGGVPGVGGGYGSGGGTTGTGPTTANPEPEVHEVDGGTTALGAPPYACASEATWRSWQTAPLAWGSMASAEYARAAIASDALPDRHSLSLDDFLARFAPPPGDTAAVAGKLYASDLSDPLKAQLDVTVFPARSELAAPALHLVVVVDTSQGMSQELAFASKVLRGLGTSLDEQGDELSVVRWSAASELVVGRSSTPAASAELAADSLEASASQLPPSAELSTTLGLLLELGLDDATHVVLLTDGGSPVELSTVARLRELGSIVSIVQLVGDQRTGDSLPFAGGLLRSVAREGQGAALWLHETISAPGLLTGRFDAVFRRASSPPLELLVPYTLIMPSSESQELTVVSHGVGAPLRAVVEAEVCSADFYQALEGETWWGQFAVLGGTPQAIAADSRAQLQWLATRGVFEVLSAGCPPAGEPVPEVDALVSLLLRAPNDTEVQALSTLLTDFTALCNAPGSGSSNP